MCVPTAARQAPLDGPLPKLRQLEHDERGRCSGTPKAGTDAAKQAAAARPEGVTTLTAKRLSEISMTEEKAVF